MGLARALALAGVGLGGLAVFNTWCRWSASPAYNRLGGKPTYYEWHHGRVFSTVDGQGEPLVLVHRPHWAAASFEWRRVFAGLAEQRRVYALDLLGFGLSDRPAVRYDAALYVRLLHDFLRSVVLRPATLVASGLSAAYAIAVAAASPELVPQLVLVSPTWGERVPYGPAIGVLLHLPVVGTSAFNLLANKRALRRTLEERTYYDPTLVDDDLVEAAYAVCQRPGSTRAAAALLAGHLNDDATSAWSRTRQPALIVSGAEAPADDVGPLLAQARPDVRHVVVPACGLLPHEEHPQRFVSVVREL